jgi:hypothetical protein
MVYCSVGRVSSRVRRQMVRLASSTSAIPTTTVYGRTVQRAHSCGGSLERMAGVSNDFNHVWRVKTILPGRKGERCRVLAYGAMNTILVEFEDGYKVTTSRFFVRQIKPGEVIQDALI